ncbi:MAG: hypothetical protein KF819_01970 [Labilithrix sp.]|nr:hypothetical protein [Labilithrix sp.]
MNKLACSAFIVALGSTFAPAALAQEVQVVSAPPPAPTSSERPPSKGTGLIIAGAIVGGLGVVNLATSPICRTDIVAPSLQDTCFYAALIGGGVLLAVGVPMLIVGLNKQATYEEWKERNRALAGVRVLTNPGGGGLGYEITF